MKRIVSILLVLGLCLGPFVVAHASNHDFRGLNTCYIRRRGNHGTEVRRIQERLVGLGYLSDRVDGSYGAKTEAAVREFQRKNGITPSGVATMFTQAVLFGSDCLAAWNNSYVSGTGTGNYGVRNVNVYRSGNNLETSFEFVNQDLHNVEAICIYFWMDTGKGRLVNMDNSDFYMQWYYNMNVPCNGTSKVDVSLGATGSELKKAHQLRCIIGEIAYTDGSVVVCMNAARQPYENDYYLLYSW